MAQATSKTVLVFVTRSDDMDRNLIPLSLRPLAKQGRCDFCNERVIYNKENYRQLMGQGKRPVFICGTCYESGEHRRQGFQ